MAPDRQTDRIVHLAHHAAAGEGETWERVAELVRECLRAGQVAFVEHEPLRRRGRILHSAGLGPECRAAYAVRFAAHNLWLRELRADPGEVLTGTEIVPNWELVRSEFYRSWLRPLAALHSVLGVMERRRDRIRCVIALRPKDGEPFGTGDKRCLVALLPGLGCACDLEATSASQRRRAQVLQDLLDCLPEAVLLVDVTARPRIANRAAKDLLALGDGLSLSGGTLATGSGEEMRRLRTLIETASAAADEPRASCDAGEVTVTRPSGEAPLVLRVSALPRAMLDADGTTWPVAAIVTGPLQAAVSDGLLAHYRLTPAETRLAELIVGGSTLLDAAAALRVSRNTARTHMKRIYAKTETHRQTDLVRLLAAGLSPLH